MYSHSCVYYVACVYLSHSIIFVKIILFLFYLQAPDILQKFDEHSVAKQHKIGVIYQKFGQVSHCN